MSERRKGGFFAGVFAAMLFTLAGGIVIGLLLWALTAVWGQVFS